MRGAQSYFLSYPVKISCQQYIFQQKKHTLVKKDFKIHGKLEQKHHKGKTMNFQLYSKHFIICNGILHIM